jgi:hypothetical protein
MQKGSSIRSKIDQVVQDIVKIYCEDMSPEGQEDFAKSVLKYSQKIKKRAKEIVDKYSQQQSEQKAFKIPETKITEPMLAPDI